MHRAGLFGTEANISWPARVLRRAAVKRSRSSVDFSLGIILLSDVWSKRNCSKNQNNILNIGLGTDRITRMGDQAHSTVRLSSEKLEIMHDEKGAR